MTSPGKTSSRGVEDEPPPHGNSSPGPDGASEIHPAAMEHQPDLGWITDPYGHHREIGRPPGTAAPNYAWSLMAQVIAGFAPVAVSGSGRWPLGVAGAQRAADPDPGDPRSSVRRQPWPTSAARRRHRAGITDVVREIGEGSSTRPGQRPRAPRHWRSRRSSVPPGHARSAIQITRSGTTLSSRLTDPVGDHIGGSRSP